MSEGKKRESGVILISYPKVVFMWPSFLAAMVAAIVMSVSSGAAAAMGWLFLIVLSLNLVIVSFDFPRTTSLLLFFAVAALLLALALTAIYIPTLIPSISKLLTSLHPEANATFYLLFCFVMAFVFLGVFLQARLDYWEVRPNELLHHHGMLSDLERFPSPHLRIEKEINDVFEYFLLGSGRLILQPSNERKAIVLDNVFWISDKEKEITKLLGALQVQVRETEPDEEGT
jgi:hypothetical protein